jgi:hypothetical protein
VLFVVKYVRLQSLQYFNYPLRTLQLSRARQNSCKGSPEVQAPQSRIHRDDFGLGDSRLPSRNAFGIPL